MRGQHFGRSFWSCSKPSMKWLGRRVIQHMCAGGGYGSEDSEAYIPLVKSALQSDVTSSGAEAAASHQQREGRDAGGASHLVGPSCLQALEGNAPSEAGGAAKVAHDCISIHSHADVAEADKETKVDLNGAGQPPLKESMKPASSEGDHAKVSAGPGAKKRKGRQKKGKSRAAKRQAQHDGTAKATPEEDQDRESPEAAPDGSVCGEQSLTDLREAALTWAQKARQASGKGQKGSTPQQ